VAFMRVSFEGERGLKGREVGDGAVGGGHVR
jgi:hypothetical protein